VVPRITTRAEVIQRLGDRFVASVRQPALAYTWELPGGRGIWWFGTEYADADRGKIQAGWATSPAAQL